MSPYSKERWPINFNLVINLKGMFMLKKAMLSLLPLTFSCSKPIEQNESKIHFNDFSHEEGYEFTRKGIKILKQKIQEESLTHSSTNNVFFSLVSTYAVKIPKNWSRNKNTDAHAIFAWVGIGTCEDSLFNQCSWGNGPYFKSIKQHKILYVEYNKEEDTWHPVTQLPIQNRLEIKYSEGKGWCNPGFMGGRCRGSDVQSWFFTSTKETSTCKHPYEKNGEKYYTCPAFELSIGRLKGKGKTPYGGALRSYFIGKNYRGENTYETDVSPLEEID